ncbi:MAG: Rep catalytic domain protein [Aguamentivirus racskinis]|uniref:Replication-associated protein n=1 Tax=Circoviridae sp. TaxID=1954248 RepID=A0A3G2YTA2_9VIRU|nr:MAG: Rep catalytic domain protein [Circoviridae sp.]
MARVPRPTGKFRIQAKKLLLTYPQCTLTQDKLFDFINGKKEVQHARICIELHQDGHPHLHAAIEFKQMLETENCRYFDLEGFHPNVEKTRNWEASLNYVKKGDNWKDYGAPAPIGPDHIDDSELVEVADSMTEREFFHYCRTKRIAYAYADRAWRMRESIFSVTHSEIPENAIIREDLDAITIGSEKLPNDTRSIVVMGPTGCGKTTWAIKNVNKPALFVTHMDGLRCLRAEHKSIIFDDMSFQHLPRETQIHIADRVRDRQIHCRYGFASIPAGIQKVFTTNVEIFGPIPEVKRRLNYIRIPDIRVLTISDIIPVATIEEE